MDKKSIDIGSIRKNIILFMMSSVAFGVVFAFLTWSIPYFIEGLIDPLYALIGSLILISILGLVVFRIMVPPLEINEFINCYLVYNIEEGKIHSQTEFNYDFWNIASMCFHELGKVKPEYQEFLKKNIELEDPLYKQFLMFVILNWLVMLNSISLFSTYRNKIPSPPRLSRDITEKFKRIHQEFYSTNLNNEFVNTQTLRSLITHITIPRNMELSITDEKINLKNKFVTIEVTYKTHQWMQDMDLRLYDLFKITRIQDSPYASISSTIRFHAKLNPLFTLNPKSDKYWKYVQDMVSNLKIKLGYPEIMEDIQETLSWKKLTT